MTTGDAPAVSAKTAPSHWDALWARPPRMRLPSRLNVTIWDLQRLLRRHVGPGTRLLEIGCAPGKLLVWAAQVLGAEVTGIDYSEPGMAHARRLFATLGVTANLHCEDVFASSVATGQFDVVFSVGVIEHFDDPSEIVRRHLAFARPGSLALMVVPHYGGIYGRLQRYFDADNLSIHNLHIMSPSDLVRLAPADLSAVARAYRFGRLAPWTVSLARRWPRGVAAVGSAVVNAIGLVQPTPIPALAPLLVLEIRRADP